jgi:hypothetical protein
MPRSSLGMTVWDVVRNPGMVSFVIDIGDPAVLQIGSIIWIVRDSRRTREELVSIGHIAEDNAMEASNAADSFIRNHAGVSDHVRDIQVLSMVRIFVMAVSVFRSPYLEQTGRS